MPALPIEYVRQPYVRGASLGQLLQLQGRNRAEAELRRGEIGAQMWGQLGQQITGAIAGERQAREQAPRLAQEAEARALTLENARAERDARTQLSKQDTAFATFLEGWDGQQEPLFRASLQTYGPQRGPEVAKRVWEAAQGQKPEQFTLSEGQSRFDETGKAIASVAKPQDGFTLGEGQSRFDATGKTIANVAKPVEPPRPVELNEGAQLVDPVSGKVIARGNPKREPQAPVTRYQPRDVLGDDGQPVTANYDAITGRHIDPRTNQPIQNPRRVPGAAETQDARKFKQAEPILAGVSELSERINTQQGAIAKIRGGVEKAKAQANYNDDVAEYEALISGFTPLVARALGHTGVLTQQDVDSVKALFPRPGDSKSLRDRKITRIKTIIGDLEAGADPSGRAKPVTITSIVEVP